MRKIHHALSIVLLLLLLSAQEALASSGKWPRSFTSDVNTITIYQPQALGWSNGILTFQSAVSVTPQGAAQPLFGTVTLCGMTTVNDDQQTIALSNISVVQSSFPTASDQAATYGSEIVTQAADWSQKISLPALQASLTVTAAEGNTSKPVAVQNTPPTIFYSSSAALLVLVDGEPALRNISASSLLRVINTQALIALDQSSGLYYLRANGAWAQSPKITGSWILATNPPAALDSLLQQVGNSGNVQLFDPPGNDGTAPTPMPKIFVSTTPAELITTHGPLAFEPVIGTQLLHAVNTDSSLFMNVANQTYYLVISGRWFSTTSLTGSNGSNGTWQFVPANQLPPDFAQIPANAPSGAVLPSVAGTTQAQEAAIAATIPQTATISRKATTTVSYDGSPAFQKIEGTELFYAPNTSTPVIKVSTDSYYAVVNGVWFTSKSPTGPWSVAASVPPTIYTIPPSSPLFYITHVSVYNSTPAAVTVGYTPGYLGTCLTPEGVVVYGTGYLYPPYIGSNLWIAPPLTYGFGAGFASGLATGLAVGLVADHGWGCTPWWGSNHGNWGNCNNNTVNWNKNVTNNLNGTHSTSLSNSAYSHWGNNVVKNSSLSQSQINNASHPKMTPDTSHLGKNNVFAGNDGNAYRSSSDGGWQKSDASGWSDADSQLKPDTQSDLDNQRYARSLGNGGDRGSFRR